MIVTITGADDNTDPEALATLSTKYPFVEWGVLLSEKREGSARYPSSAWLSSASQIVGRPYVRFSAHLCGGIAREFMQGRTERLLGVWTWCDRMQINGYEPGAESAVVLRQLARNGWDRLILQARGEDALVACAADALFTEAAAVLYDPSGGRGIGAGVWPDAPRGVRAGYAGGINPGNVVSVLGHVAPLGATWIDMESGVRDEGDRLDLERVAEVLARADEWMRGPSQ